ncbi:MAG: glycosyltransferase [Actinobacteria bacterium]|nr:glycosyltransferase [Actinomycetota bacterium]
MAGPHSAHPGLSPPDVSIIIIANRPTPFLSQALRAIQAIEHPVWEVVGVLNDAYAVDDARVRFIASGRVGPAEKRDLGARHARAPVLAFLDDDAYPSPGWLAAALPPFADPHVAAVGGPGLTPPEDGFWQQVSGWVYSSIIGSAGLRYRYVPGRGRDVDDFPSMNLLVRRSAFEAAGGFDSAFYPGEDTKLCLELTRRGGRIVYEPGALVYHHRRALWPGHARQVAAYGRHRGYFAKRYPATSLRPHYFIPTAFVAWLVAGPFLGAWLGVWWGWLYVASLAAYGLALAVSGIDVAHRGRSAWLGLAVVPGLLLTHLVYGLTFVHGLLARRP